MSDTEPFTWEQKVGGASSVKTGKRLMEQGTEVFFFADEWCENSSGNLGCGFLGLGD